MDKEYVDKVINSYTRTEMRKEPRSQFHDWLVDSKFSEEKEGTLLELWNKTENLPTQETLTSFISLQKKRESKRFKKAVLIYSMVASVVIVLFVSLFYIQNNPPHISFVEHFSETGKMDLIHLPDGSIVYANSKTILIYPESFGENLRTIYLSGEANFKIKKSETPFIVQTQGFSITALGTEFDISSYPDDLWFRTTLINGSIKISQPNKTEKILSQEGDQFTYNKQLDSCTIHKVNIEEATAWQKGELLFRGVTLKEILNVLERSKGVFFRYNDTIFNDDKFNFRFKKEASISEIMEILKKIVTNFDYKKVDEYYYLTSK